jgi:hypothetical protein
MLWCNARLTVALPLASSAAAKFAAREHFIADTVLHWLMQLK